MTCNDMQFGFMLACDTTGAILMYASDRISSMPSTIHWTLPFSRCKRHAIVYPDTLTGGFVASLALMIGWYVSPSMYENARGRVCVCCKLSEEFRLKVGVHQSSCRCSILCTTDLETLSKEFTGPSKNAILRAHVHTHTHVQTRTHVHTYTHC